MFSRSWVRWLRSWFAPRVRTYRKPEKNRYRFAMEELEARYAPATYVWDGGAGAGNTNWSAGQNWVGDIAPPTKGTNDLIFPSGVSQLNSNNNLVSAVFNSITFSGSGYTLTGNAITLGSSTTSGGGFITSNQSTTNNTIALGLTLGAADGSQQFVTTSQGSTLTISGAITGPAGVALSKEGTGTLILSGSNSNLAGAVTVKAGILAVSNSNALGGATTSNGTTVLANAQLQVRGAGTVSEALILNGLGINNDGALLNVSGNNTWSGNITLDSSVIIGADAGSLDISGVISDLGSGHNITKEGTAEIKFSGNNTYRGLTTINNGPLTIGHGSALGAGGSASNGTIVRTSIGKVGTLQLDNATGFTVRDELLTLNSFGIGSNGSLRNLRGNNVWAADITLGSPSPNGSNVGIGVDANSSLRVSGVIDNPNGDFSLTKLGAGTLIFDNANKYKSATIVSAGVLSIRDSQALGDPTGAGTTVNSGAALWLEVDTGTSVHGRDFANDSVTGYNGNGPQPGLRITEAVNVSGTGMSNTGALRSVSGINTWASDLTLNATTAIGVDPDPNPSNTSVYFTRDYSLTFLDDIVGGSGTTVRKVGAGHLILPNDNPYTGATVIEQGWVTAQTERALGALGTGSDSSQPTTTVMSGASLHLKPKTAGTNFNLIKNLVLSGTGITHPFDIISGAGALVSLGGKNTIGGPVNGRISDIKLDGQAGIGVELVGPDTESELTITAAISDFPGGSPGGITKLGSKRLILQGEGNYSGDVNINEGVVLVQHNTALGTASTGTSSGTNSYTTTNTTIGSGIAEIQTVTLGGATGTFRLNFNGAETGDLATDATATQVRTALNGLATIGGIGGSVTVSKAGTIYSVSFGGSLTGSNQGQLTATASAGVTVAIATLIDGDGAALELGLAPPANNGGISAGLAIWHERLVIGGQGNNAFGIGPLTVRSNDNFWQGPVTLRNSTTLRLEPAARMVFFGPIDDQPNSSPNGSDLTLVGGGQLTLAGENTYRGMTFVTTGLLSIHNSQALGSTGISETQTITVTGDVTGGFSLAFNGESTGGFTAAATALQIESALNQLSTIAGVGGSVTVTQVTNVYTVTFEGNLTGFDQNLLTASAFGGTNVAIGLLRNGGGGTVVSDGAALQLQGSLTVAGEPLKLSGDGDSATTNVPVGWFPMGPAPINDWPTAGTNAVSGRVTAVVADPRDSNVIFIATAGGGVWKTINSGRTWQPLFDFQNGQDERQTVTVTGTTGTFALTFNGQTTQPLSLGASALQVEVALNSLSSVGGAFGSVVVTKTTSATDTVYSVTFAGNLAGTNVNAMTATVTGDVTATIATPTEGINSTLPMYIGTMVMDPSDPRTLYIGTGETNNSPDSFYGTGIYKSTDAGKTWALVVDTTTTPGTSINPFDGKGISKIIVDTSDTTSSGYTLYVAAGDGGVGRNESQRISPFINTNSTFTLTFTGPDSTGAIVSQTTTSITYDNRTTASRAQTALDIQNALNALSNIQGIGGVVTVSPPPTSSGGHHGGGQSNRYTVTFLGALAQTNVQEMTASPFSTTFGEPTVNVSTTADGGSGKVVNGTSGGAGIWRYRGGVWFNMTSVTSNDRQNTASANQGPPRTPGPNDDYQVSFPQSNATWSDVALIYTSRDNGSNSGPVIYGALGTGSGNGNNGVFWTKNPTSNNPVWYVGNPGGTDQSPATAPSAPDARSTTAFPWGSSNGSIKLGAVAGGTLITTRVYASTATSTGSLRAVYQTTNGGHAWTATSGTPSNYMGALGAYANAILVNGNTIYVAGHESSNTTHANIILRSTDAGATWTDISVDSNGDGPHTLVHSLALDSSGRLLVGTDGGPWRQESSGLWTNLNGNLSIAQINSIVSHPTDLTVAYAGVQSNGTALFDDELSWTTIDGGGGGQIRIDPSDPNIMYHVQLQPGANAQVRRSTDAGANWTTILSPTASTVPLALDTVDTKRVLVGGTSLQESQNSGTSWLTLNSGTVKVLALATYQGAFVDDPDFTQVTDKGANTYDPDTIYFSDGDKVFVTKNHGQSWQDRTTDLDGLGSIYDMVVDPRNRDTVYLVRNVFGANDRVLRTTDAGQSWEDLTSNLPNLPVWKIVLDPRTNDLYVGTDRGVYLRKAGTTSWTRLGAGLPNVQVRDLDLNINTNVLLAGTYGRGVYRMFLNDLLPNPGALRVTSGTSIWTGPIIMAGDTTIRVDGTQTLQSGVATAQLTVLGTVSDLTNNADFTLTKTGGGDLVLGGANTYGGLTDVQAGVLAVKNQQALGASDKGTTVRSGAVLQLQSNLDLEPITLNGNGVSFNGHNAGALRSFTGDNTYTGQLTLASNTTIGVDSGSKLTITNVIDDGPSSFSLTKELTGTLVLAANNTYGGVTRVNQGILAISKAGGLGTSANGTEVRDGAQLNISGGITVVGEALRLSGTGIGGAGALVNTADDNVWEGGITFDYLPGFSPDTTPPDHVAIGVASGTTLTVDGVVNQDTTDTGAPDDFGLTKVGAGKLVLMRGNSYSGKTTIAEGVLNIRSNTGLGTAGNGPTNGTEIASGAALELAHATGITTAEELILNGNGVSGNGAVRVLSGANTFSGPVILKSSTTINTEGTSSLRLTGVVQEPSPAPTTAPTLTKTGTGTLVLTNTNTYTGQTTINQGVLQVDGTIGNVRLNGGTLGGGGAVGAVTTQTAGGGVNPGSPSTTGILDTQNVTLNSATTFSVDLNGTTAGTQHDQLNVVGTIDLGGATLSGTAATSIAAGGSFTIITASGGVSGTFNGLADLGTLYLGGRKFTIDYTSTSVILTAAKDDATISLSTSQTPSVFGQGVGFTAVVSPVAPAFGDPTGNVVFMEGTTVLATVALSGGTANYIAPNLSLGTHTITASYAGDAKYNAAPQNASVVQTVVQASTTTTVSSSLNPSFFGDSVTFSITVSAVSPSTGTPTGGIYLIEGGNIIASGALTNGQATFNLSTLSVGTHSLTAAYAGDGNYAGSNSSVLSQVVNRPATSTALTTSGTPSTFGDSVTFTATITAPSTPTGTVTFKAGTTVLGTGTVSSNVATLTLSNLGAGSHTITAEYSGDANLSPSTSSSVTQVVDKANTQTSLASSPNPSTPGQSVTFTATVTGPGTLTGAVDFMEGTTVLGSGTVSGGVATFSTSSLSFGAHTIHAVYSGDANRNASTSSTITHTVLQASSTALTSDANPSIFGQSVTFTATVTPGTSGNPTGTVSFREGTTELGTGTLSSGIATFTTSTLTVGAHAVTAVYLGDSGFVPSTSSAVNQQVNKASTATVVVSSDNQSVFGQSVTFTATVSDASFSAGTPGGSVTFMNGSTTLGTGALSGGVATFTISTLTAGSYSISAVYGGDARYLTSASAAITQQVDQALSGAVVVSGTNPSTFGQSVTFTATVSDASFGTSTPTGTVSFLNGTTTLGTSTLSNGSATFSTSSLNAGNNAISVVYSGDANFQGASSASITQVVNQASTSTTLASSKNPSGFGQSVTFTATVTGPGTATGTVDFMNGTTLLQTVALSSGSAAFTTSSLGLGTHSISAVYSGDANRLGGTSNTVSQVILSVTSMALTSSSNPSTFGDSVTFTATASGTATPTGNVIFKNGSTTLGTVALSSGVATFTTSTLTGGSHTITAVYEGDSTQLGSEATITQTVNKASTSVGLSSSANPVNATVSVTFTATVTGPTGVVPTGTVTFKDGGTILGTQTLSSGVATFSTNALLTGTHSITATYNGDGNHQASTSAILSQVVTTPPATNLKAATVPAFGVGIGSAFSINVTARDAFGNVATSANGTVTMTVISTPAGGTLQGSTTATFVNGVATFTGLKLSRAGSYVVRITFGSLTTDLTITTVGRLV